GGHGFIAGVRVEGGGEGEAARQARRREAAGGGREDPLDLEEEHDPQRRHTEYRDRRRNLRGARRWRTADLRAGGGVADGATLLYVLKPGMPGELEMIYVVAETRLRESVSEKIKEAGKKVVAETVKEKGCIAYDFYVSITDPTKLVAVERWETREQLSVHGET